MDAEALIKGLHAIKLQASSVSVVNDTLNSDRVTLSKAHSLISENKEAVKMVLAYCRHTDISVPDVEEKPFLQWCAQREAYFDRAVQLGYCK